MDDYEAEQTWSWLADAGLSSLDMAACITFVRGATQAQILDAFGADQSVSHTYDDDPHGGSTVAVAPYGEGFIVIEENGWGGSDPEVLHALGAPGVVAAGMHWNINGVEHWSMVRGGIISIVDPWQPDGENSTGEPPDGVLTAFAALDLMENDVDPRPLGMQLAAEVVGLPLLPLPDRASLRVHPGKPLGSPMTDGSLSIWALTLPRLLRRLQAAGPRAQRDLAAQVAREAVADIDIRNGPGVEAVVAQLYSSDSPSFAPAAGLMQELHAELQQRLLKDPSRSGSPSAWVIAARLRVQALALLETACRPDPAKAAVGVLEAAVTFGRMSGVEMLARVQAFLDERGVPAGEAADPVPEYLVRAVETSDAEEATKARARRIASGLEPDDPDPDSIDDQVLALPAALAAWEDTWRSLGAPVDQALAPGASASTVRESLGGLSARGTEIVEAWFGWHDGGFSTPWWAAPADPGQLLSLTECLAERARAQAVVEEHRSYFPFDTSPVGGAAWMDSYVPLLAAHRGRTLGVDLDTGLVWSGLHDAGQFPNLTCRNVTLTAWVLQQVEGLSADGAPTWTGERWSTSPEPAVFGGTASGDPEPHTHPTREHAADPETVAQLAAELPGLLRSWEDMWRGAGLPEEGVLAPGLSATEVRERLEAQNLHADPTLAQLWFGWHDGALHEGFTANVGPFWLLSLDEALNERAVIHDNILRIIREGRDMGQLTWSPHVLPLVQNSTAFGASSICVDLATGRLWDGRWYSPSAGFHPYDSTINQYVEDEVAKHFDRRRTSWTDTGWTFKMDPDVL